MLAKLKTFSMMGIDAVPVEVEVDDELYVFHGGANVHHDWWMVGLPEGLDVPESGNLDHVNYALGLAKMKRDRFVSLAAGPARTEILVTPPMAPAAVP